jgi:thiol:disulfide interchange protein DsbD
MGASLGLALTLPAVQALAVFGAIGLGMALPYLAASLVPAVARRRRRPGPWMDVLRKCLAFPMWGTVVWLVWVLGQQSGMNGAGALLALLVCMAWVLWALSLQGRVRKIVASISIASFALLAWTTGPYMLQMPTDEAPHDTSTVDTSAAPWQAWAPDKVDALLAQGRPVFVDFTAAWCVTRQYNKQTTLSDSATAGGFSVPPDHAAARRLDLPRPLPSRRTALCRNGVPVYVIYRPGAAPVLLPEILSVAEVRAAL